MTPVRNRYLYAVVSIRQGIGLNLNILRTGMVDLDNYLTKRIDDQLNSTVKSKLKQKLRSV